MTDMGALANLVTTGHCYLLMDLCRPGRTESIYFDLAHTVPTVQLVGRLICVNSRPGEFLQEVSPRDYSHSKLSIRDFVNGIKSVF